MLFKEIDFPQEILRAREAAELVIFAGAGVSKPPPSSLPLFLELAERIGKGCGITLEANEAPDHYLGKLKDTGVNVHEASSRILVNDQTKPHALHRLLYELFPSRDAVRIVTTNFDTHFSTAARELYGTDINTYCAPALPLGNDFHGLVYLHGCAGKEPNRCVLTDEDFGRAYLTEAWAARFIASMFSQYVVVFVGYSYNDVVMNYLARGLPPKAQRDRFAFSLGDPASLLKWSHLSIKPLVYQKTTGPNSHQQITDATAKVVEVMSSGFLGTATRIESMLQSPPPLEGEDSDYLKFCLTGLETARIFFTNARQPKVDAADQVKWLDWLDVNAFVKPLCDSNRKLEDFYSELAFWLTDQLITSHTQELLAVIHKNGRSLNRIMCFWIYRRLFLRDTMQLPSRLFSVWSALLLSQQTESLSREELGLLLTKCQLPEDKSVALLLFERLLRPHVTLDEQFSFSTNPEEISKRIGFGLNLLDDKDMWTAPGWNTVLKPNLSLIALDLEPILSQHLATANALMNLDNIGDDYNPLYRHRPSISTKRSAITALLDVLVDSARDTIAFLIDAEPTRANIVIERWLNADAPILRKLAIFGYSQRNNLSADDKLQWLLEKDLIYRFQEEVNEILYDNYGVATEKVRIQILDRVSNGPRINTFDEERRTRSIHRLLARLKRIAPNCDLTAERLKIFLQAHPQYQEFERSLPTIRHLPSDFMNEIGAFDIDKILNAGAAEFLKEALLHIPDVQLEYCNAASSATDREPEWGIQWLTEVQLRNINNANLWTCICGGWKAAKLQSHQWTRILDFVLKMESPPKEFFESLIELLVEGSKREEFAIPDDKMQLAQNVAELIWERTLSDTPARLEYGFEDWLTQAINEPGGRLGEFWLHCVSASRRLEADSWTGLPSNLRVTIERLLSETSGSAAYIRIIFASQLHYMFSLDPKFTSDKLLPLFDWNLDSLRAEQSWHGFLIWGRWLPGLLESLLPHFMGALARITAFPGDTRERLADSAAVMAIHGIENPLEGEFMVTLFNHCEDVDLVHFAWGVGNLLEKVQSPIVERIWTRWLREYWRRRSEGIPKPISTSEADIMASWTLDLGAYFADGVAMLYLIKDRLSFEHSRLLIDLDDKEMINKHAKASADLILLYLGTSKSRWYSDQHTKKIWSDLKQSGLPQERLMEVREGIFRKSNLDPESL